MRGSFACVYFFPFNILSVMSGLFHVLNQYLANDISVLLMVHIARSPMNLQTAETSK